jgi:hypothetical protein
LEVANLVTFLYPLPLFHGDYARRNFTHAHWYKTHQPDGWLIRFNENQCAGSHVRDVTL